MALPSPLRKQGVWLLQEKKLGKAQAHFDATWKKFQEAIDVLPEGDRGKKLKPIQVSIFHRLSEDLSGLVCYRLSAGFIFRSGHDQVCLCCEYRACCVTAILCVSAIQ